MASFAVGNDGHGVAEALAFPGGAAGGTGASYAARPGAVLQGRAGGGAPGSKPLTTIATA